MMHKTITVFGKQIPVWALAAAAGALGLVLVMRARSKGTSVVSAGTTAAAAAAAQAASAATTYDPNLQGLVSGSPYAGTADYGSEMAQIQAQLTALANPPGPTTPAYDPTVAPAVAAYMGSGYYNPGITVTPTGNWQYVGDPGAVAGLGGYAALDYMALPGVFKPWNPQLAPGTPMYASTPYSTLPPPPVPPAGAASTAQHVSYAQAASHSDPVGSGLKSSPFLTFNPRDTTPDTTNPVGTYGVINPAGLSAPALGIHA